MKKFFVLMSIAVLALTLSACGKKEEGKFDVENGTYFAVADTFAKGYKYWVTVEVKDKFIKKVEWNGYHIDGGASGCKGYDKYECSVKGFYGMETKDPSNTKGAWHVQAKAATDWIVKKQKLDVTFDAEGNADAVTTVTIHTKELFDLVNEALDSDPVAKGTYKDGFYYIEGTKTDKDFENHAVLVKDGVETPLANKVETIKSYTFGSFLVVNGTIVIADFNSTHAAYEYKVDTNGDWVVGESKQLNGKTTKLYYIIYTEKTSNGTTTNVPKVAYVTKDAAGEWYGMAQAGKVEWDVQIKAAEVKLLADQKLTFTADNKIDGVASVTMGGTVGAMKGIMTAFDTQAK